MANSNYTYTVSVDRDSVPTLTILSTADVWYRSLRSVMHQAAAWLEEATPDSERWYVGTRMVTDNCASIFIETATIGEAEHSRAESLLHKFIEVATKGAK